jgi:hypothetical protein
MPRNFQDGFEALIDRSHSRCLACHHYISNTGPLIRTCNIKRAAEVKYDQQTVDQWLENPQLPNGCKLFLAIRGMA